MIEFFRRRSLSLSMVVLVMGVIMALQASLSISIAFGRLGEAVQTDFLILISSLWTILRGGLVAAVVVLWLMNRRRPLFRLIILLNGIYTFALFINMVTLVDILFGVSSQGVESLIADVVLMAAANILIFSIGNAITEPPGVTVRRGLPEPWGLRTPQRGGNLPRYENWQPRYTDYLFLAFTSSFAFSPTDTLPLTRRAKLLMMLQATISLITITAIAGSAINILASGS